MALTVLLAGLVGPVSGAPGAALSAQQILQKTAENYRGVTGYAVTGGIATHMTIQGKSQDVTNALHAYYGGPGRSRFEAEADGAETLFLQSGDSIWTYLGGLGQYAVSPASAIDSTRRTLPGIDPFARHPLAGYARLGDHVAAARRLDDAARVVDGQSVPAYVVEVSYDTTVVPQDSMSSMAPKRLWIDQSRFLVLADSLTLDRRSPVLPEPVHIAQMASLTSLAWNTTPADSLFAFQAPAGAQRVERLGATPGGRGAKGASAGGGDGPDPMIGQAAPLFLLHDLTGVKRSLADLEGKVVLLDFWATWCGPCRRELPTIQKLHERYALKGLAVVGINCSEGRSTAASFLRSNRYSMPTWLDVDGAVQNQYQVDGIPTLFILDAKGVIVAHLVGLRDEAELLQALKKAGLKTRS